MAKKKVSDAEMRRNRDFMAAQTERMEQQERNRRLSIESVDRVFGAWQSKAETAHRVIVKHESSDGENNNGGLPARQPTPTATLPNGSGMFTPKELADQFKVPLDPLRKRLDRWRKKHLVGSDWTEVEGATSREAKYLYRLKAITQIIEDLKEGSPSSERPAK